MTTMIDQNGYLIAEYITPKPYPGLERGEMKIVRGIIIHQTDGSTAQSTWNSYLKPKANGAHFLIDKYGRVFQTASLFKRVNHVGKLKAKCLETHTCGAAELKAHNQKIDKYKAIHQVEMLKSVPSRFPANHDSIGIEIVGRCNLHHKYIKPDMTSEVINDLRNKYCVFEKLPMHKMRLYHA